MTGATLSILTPTYNGMPFLVQAVGSVEPYIRAGWVEHIVADGGSNDGSVEFLEQSSVRYVSRPDRGQSDALNTAFSMASGEWIGWLNCDEFYVTGVLDRILEIIDRDDCDLIYGDFIEVTPDNDIIRLVSQHSVNRTVLEHFGLSLPSCTAFIRTSSVRAAGGWSLESKTMMDWELWLEILRQGGRFRYTGRAHAGFTRHEMQASARLSELVACEHDALNQRFGIASNVLSRRNARALRVLKKVANGGYKRELAFNRALRRDGNAGRSEHSPAYELIAKRFERFVLV